MTNSDTPRSIPSLPAIKSKEIKPQTGIIILMVAQMASEIGDSAFLILLLWTCMELNSKGSVVGFVGTLTYLPILLFSIIGGWAADKYSRRMILFLTEFLRGILIISIPFMASMGCLNPLSLAITGFLVYSCAAFFNPARDAIIPELTDESHIVRANSLIQVSIPLGLLLGPSISAIAMKVADTISLFTLVAFFFLISSLVILLLPRGGKAGSGRAIRNGIMDGVRLSMKDPSLKWLLFITAVDNLFIMGPAIVGTPLFVKWILKRGDSEYATIMAAYAVGMLIGLPITNLLIKKLHLGPVLILAIFLDGITYFPLFFVKSVSGTFITIVFHSLAIPMIMVTRTSIVQRVVKPLLLGRVFALIGMTVLGLTSISCALTGLLSQIMSINKIFGIIAILASLCAPLAATSKALRTL